jgi:anaerobic selenocysteine-containing dehydrogenase
MSDLKTQFRTCNICEAMCGLIVTYDETEVHSIKPNPEDPLSRGHICPKAIALQDFRTDPDRVTTPLKKVDGEFVPISWDEAYDFAAQRARATWQGRGWRLSGQPQCP